VIGKKLIDVSSLLSKIRSEAIALSDGKHEITLTTEPGLWLKSNEEQLRSAFSNLVFNAVRYTPEGGKIKINWSQLPNGEAQFTCTDNGDGIAQEHISRLTERFYRVDQARTRDSGGSGLGLSIVKHVLTNHDSELKISSQLQVGSCFSFIINKLYVELHDSEQASSI